MLTQTMITSGTSRSMRHGTRTVPPVHGQGIDGPIEMIGAPMSFTRNTEIYGENEPAEYLYKVISGKVRTYKVLNDGRRQIGAFYIPGDVFGLEFGDQHAFSAEAIIDSKVLVIKRSAVVGLAKRDNEVARELWTLTGRELQRVQDHIMLLVKTAQERVAGFLLEMAARVPASNAVELPMSRQDIADYLGLTIETVSRQITRLRSRNLIKLESKRWLTVPDIDKLAKAAETENGD
jgi:CRP/FNR family nitrogen fixation transcriptional regulator